MMGSTPETETEPVAGHGYLRDQHARKGDSVGMV
jgi:hypothetical protein